MLSCYKVIFKLHDYFENAKNNSTSTLHVSSYNYTSNVNDRVYCKDPCTEYYTYKINT